MLVGGTGQKPHVGIGANPVNDEISEVELKINATANCENGQLYVIELVYAGLVGVRTPYGAPRNAVDPEIVPGGSSGGSGVVVGHGAVAFSLGTDTAGSGRVPAALNNIVGLKPTLGALSAGGVVPACRTLDTVSVFALTVDDAFAAFEDAGGAFDPEMARKLEKHILSAGGSQEAEALYLAFRGRMPGVEALLKGRGLAS